MAVIDAISNSDTRRHAADVASVGAEPPVEENDNYRVALMKSIPQTPTSTPPIDGENATSVAVPPPATNGRLELKSINVIPVQAASDAVVQPADPEGDSESLPPAGLVTALSTAPNGTAAKPSRPAVSQNDQPQVTADKPDSRSAADARRNDEPLKPPRGFFHQPGSTRIPTNSNTTVAVDVSADDAVTANRTDRNVNVFPIIATPAASVTPAVNSQPVHPGANSESSAAQPTSPAQPSGSAAALTAAIQQPATAATAASAPTQSNGGGAARVNVSAIAPAAARTASGVAEIAAASVSESTLPGMKKSDDPKSREPQTQTQTQTSSPSSSSPVARPEDSQSKAAVVSTPDGPDRNELVQRCSDAVQHAAQSNRPFRVRLHPPELGALLVEISRDDNVVSARLQVETASAQQALTEQLADLRQSLSRHGVTVDRIDVQLVEVRTLNTSRQEADDRGGESSPREQQQHNSPDQHDGREEPPRRKPADRFPRIARVTVSRDEMDIQI